MPFSSSASSRTSNVERLNIELPDRETTDPCSMRGDASAASSSSLNQSCKNRSSVFARASHHTSQVALAEGGVVVGWQCVSVAGAQETRGRREEGTKCANYQSVAGGRSRRGRFQVLGASVQGSRERRKRRKKGGRERGGAVGVGNREGRDPWALGRWEMGGGGRVGQQVPQWRAAPAISSRSSEGA